MMPMCSVTIRASASVTVATHGRPCPVPALFRSWFIPHASSYSVRSIRRWGASLGITGSCGVASPSAKNTCPRSVGKFDVCGVSAVALLKHVRGNRLKEILTSAGH